jgi:hypothetical protein
MANYSTTQLLSILQQSGIQTQYPTLYDVIRGMIVNLDRISEDIITVSSVIGITTVGGYAPNVSGFSATSNGTNIILSWTSLGAGYSYEIREGVDWATADYVTTTLGNSVPLDPRVVGAYKFLIKAIDGNSRYSETAASTEFIVHSVGSVVVSTTVLGNSINFTWTEPTSTFYIDYYNVYKDGNLIGYTSGNFFSYFETTSGTFDYKIVAVDLAGNESPDVVNAQVNAGNPTDFVLVGSQSDSSFTGTKTNALVDVNGLLVPVNITETYQEHFDNHSWSTPDDQVAAGYPRFIQPSMSTAEYEKVFDFGTSYDNVIANIIYVKNNLVGNVSITSEISFSEDDITYSSPTSGIAAFSLSARYVKVVLTFTPNDTDNDLAVLTSLVCNLNVKLEQDGGNATVESSDPDGTTITFNKNFLSVNSITVTPVTSSGRTVVIDYDYDTVDPVNFSVYVYDLSGVRQSEIVGWHARGIIG